jgi:hypothetical protein
MVECLNGQNVQSLADPRTTTMQKRKRKRRQGKGNPCPSNADPDITDSEKLANFYPASVSGFLSVA